MNQSDIFQIENQVNQMDQDHVFDEREVGVNESIQMERDMRDSE